MELMKPVILGQASALPDQNQFQQARTIITNIYDNKINLMHQERHRFLEVIDYLEKNDPTCIFHFDHGDDLSTYKFDFCQDIQPQIEAIRAGKEPQAIAPKIKAKMTRIANKRKKDALSAIK